MYNPAVKRTKNANPKAINVMYFGKQPTNAKYSNPTKNPINSAHLIISYPLVKVNFTPSSSEL